MAELPRCPSLKGSSTSQRDSLEHRADVRERAEVLSVTVALNYLGRDGSDGKAKPLANALFDLRTEMGCRPNGAGNLPDFHLRDSLTKARNVSLIFRKPVSDL